MGATASRSLAPQPGKDPLIMTLPNDLKASTIAAQAGGVIDTPSGGVVPPVQPSTTFVRDEDYALVNPDNIYSRDNSDIVRITEAVLARLEGAEEALLFPSGMAAIAALFRTLPNGAIDRRPVGHLLGHDQMAARFLRPPPDHAARGRRRRSGGARGLPAAPIPRVLCSSKPRRIPGSKPSTSPMLL
jgi:hypothetical protein